MDCLLGNYLFKWLIQWSGYMCVLFEWGTIQRE